MIFWFEKHNKVSWIITILIAGIIFYLSSLSFKGASTGGFGWQTTAYHFYAFFFLSIFLLISLIKGKPKNKNLIFISIILAIIYGISDEIHQLFVLGRTCAIYDVLINSTGILFASLLYCLRIKFRIKQRKQHKQRKKTLLKQELRIYFLLIFSLVLAFFIYFLIISFYINPFLENYSDLNKSPMMFKFYNKSIDCNKIYYWGSSSIKEDIDVDLIDKLNSSYCHYNLGNPASTPLRRVIELEDTINSNPSIVVFGVGYKSFSNNWLFPYDQYALISQDINKKEIPSLYNKTYTELLSMNKFELLLYKRKFLAPATKNLLERIRHRLLGTKKPYYFKEYNNGFKSQGILLQEKELKDPEFLIELENKKEFKEYSVPFEKNIEKSSFEFIIEELSENNVPVLVVKIPINPLLLDEIDEKYKINFDDYLDDISKKYNLSVLSYTSTYNSTYFYDGHHLNKNGKEIFSQDLGLKILDLI